MPLEKSKLSNIVRTCTVVWEGNEITLTYNADALSQKRRTAMSVDPDGEHALRELISELVVEWDIVEDGEPIPCTEGVLEEFHSSLCAAIYQQCELHMQGTVASEGKALVDAYVRKARSGLSPNGIDSSPQPVTTK